MSEELTPFRIDVPESELDDLRAKVTSLEAEIADSKTASG